MATFSVMVAFSMFMISKAYEAPGCPGNKTAVEVMNGTHLAGKVAIVTGGDSGLGFAMAEALATLGVHVVIGAHNLTKGVAKAKNITAATGTQVDVLALDLQSKSAVHTFADEFLKKYTSGLHFLINNAGIGNPSYRTKDGFESHPSRIVNVASSAHQTACAAQCAPEDCFKDWTYIPTPVSNCTPPPFIQPPFTTYGAAKFFLIMHAKALAQREVEHEVEAFSINPGYVATEATFPHGFDPSDPGLHFACMAQSHPPSLPPQQCPFSPGQGAAATAYAATSSNVAPGAYYDRVFGCEEKEVVMQGFSDAMIPELYTRSLVWAGLETREVMV